MSLSAPTFDSSVVRNAGAEVVGGAPVAVQLPADSSASGGALSTVCVTLTEGADGVRPHLHENSADQELYDNHFLRSAAWYGRR